MNSKALWFEKTVPTWSNFPCITITIIRKTAIITALTAVAVLVSTPCNPILPNIATKEAVTADNIANTNQE
jgi:hypothetical protein